MTSFVKELTKMYNLRLKQWPIPSMLPHAEPSPFPSPSKSMLKWLHVNIKLKNNTDIGEGGDGVT